MPQNSFNYDVIITGSGPAGAAAAYFLAEGNFKALVLEKEILPRYKTCGGGIVSRAKNLLPFSFDEIVDSDCSMAEVYDHGSGKYYLSRRTSPIIMMTMRRDLDSYILSKAGQLGADIKDNCTVKNIVTDDNLVHVHTDSGVFTSKFVIAADGATGIVNIKLKQKELFKRLPAIECEVYADSNTILNYSGKARFDFGIPENGYGWVFPKKDHLSIGVISMSEARADLNAELKKYLNILCLDKVNRIDKHGYFIPVARKYPVVYENRILYTGDSAGLADPLFGEGISSAILSGRLAAEAVIKSRFNPASAAGIYNKDVYNLVIRENRYAGRIAYFVYKFPKTRTFLFRYYGQKLSEIITDIFSGRRKYSALLRSPKSYFKLIIIYLYKKFINQADKEKISAHLDNTSGI